MLNDGEEVTFGLEDSFQLIFRSASGTAEEAIPQLLTRIDHMTSSESTGGGLRKLNMLLEATDRKSTRLNSSHQIISYAVFCLKKKNRIVHCSRNHQRMIHR